MAPLRFVARAELPHLLVSRRELSKQLLLAALALPHQLDEADDASAQLLGVCAVFALRAFVDRRDIVGALALVV